MNHLNPKKHIVMKATNPFWSLAAVACLWSAASLTGCTVASTENAAAPAANIIESTEWVGVWQKYVEVDEADEDGNVVSTSIQPTNLFKVILADGNYFLFRATPNGHERSVDSRIEVYGTYRLTEAGKAEEYIMTNCAKPELSGISSDVNYSMPDKDHMNVYYSLHSSDGTAGSSEYVPELWYRVATN